MEGFSDKDTDVAIGYVLGLRWFQLNTRMETIPEAISWNGAGQELMPTMPSRAVEVPVLHGAYGWWQPGENTAAHQGLLGGPEDHVVPVRRCKCGFWAYWTLGSQQTGSPHIAALVKGWDRMVEGPLGFRCSKAEILALVPAAWDSAAALALEARYQVPVYSTIGALLEMHKAPAGQPPLKDDWFCREQERREQASWAAANSWAGAAGGASSGGWTSGSCITGGGGGGYSGSGGSYASGGVVRGSEAGRRYGESYTDYARRIGFLPANTMPCITCGKHCCRTGQGQCTSCQMASLPDLVTQATEAQKKMDDAITSALSGVDAITQLHARREGWARDANAPGTAQPDLRRPGPAVLPPDPPATRPPVMAPSPDASWRLRWAWDYMKNKYGGGGGDGWGTAP